MQNTSTQRQRSRLLALTNLSGVALRAGSIEALMGTALETIAHELEVPRAGVFEAVGGTEPSMRLRWGLGWRSEHIGSLTVPVATVHKGDEPVLLGEPESAISDPMLAIGMIRGFTVPISAGHGTLRSLGCFTDELERSFADDEIAFLSSIADLLAAAMARDSVEESLRSSQQRLAMAQRIAHMGSYDWHIATDTNVWSDELYRIYGAEPQSFNASYEKFLSLVHPDDRERVVAVHRRALETGEPYEMEERIIRPDGAVRILETNGEVITDEAGRPVRMVGICFDVTEQRQAAEAARKYEEMQGARKQALEINDSVVQGIATIVYALERNRVDLALTAAGGTLDSVRGMISGLLTESADVPIVPGLLRRAEPPTTCLPQEKAQPSVPGPSAIRVVIADDSEDMRLMLRFALTTTDGFEVVGEAADGRRALSVIEETAPDVVLLDLAMPKMDGLEVAHRLRERGSAPAVVVMSGFDAGRLAPLALEQGASLYIEKGTAMADLREKIQSLFPNRGPAADTRPRHNTN